MKKKKKQKKREASVRASDLSAPELEELQRALKLNRAASDGDFLALVKHLEGDQDAAGLQALFQAADSKTKSKALKRALHHLGVAVRPEAVRVVQSMDPGESLPMLMASPEPNATRIFTFAEPSGAAGVTVIEAYFCMPEGLYRLKSSPSTPAEYRNFAKTMVQQGRATMPRGMLERKKWEIRQYAKKGHVGKEFERRVANELEWPHQVPLHPARDLDLGDGTTVSMNYLESKKALIPFEHGTAQEALKRDWDQAGGAMITSRKGGSWLDGSVKDWAQQWGIEAITELFLDYAVFFARRSEPNVALTLREVVSSEDPNEQRDRVFEFLKGFVQEELS